jgi:hypothetical protein
MLAAISVVLMSPRPKATPKSTSRLLRLATLDPSIVQAILDGRQPPSLTRMRLAKITNLPIDWASKRLVLGFA